VHVPDWHVSLCVHLSPSLQVVPSFFVGFVQAPVPGSQLPASWHWSDALQVTAAPAVQAPA
jgi:hypothetical protein